MATERQKIAFDKIMENHGNVSKAMREAGYTNASAKNPKNLTQSKGWVELVEQYLPDSLLAETHHKGLEATTKKPQLVDRDDKGRPIYDYVPEEDFSTRHKYLDTAYKLKGVYAPEKLQVNSISDVLDNLEDGQETTQQEVENESPIQDQEQGREIGDIQNESSAESLRPEQVVSQPDSQG